MAALTIPYNHARDPMSPGQLADQIAAALTVARPQVDIDPTSITVTGTGIGPAKQSQIQAVVDAYVFDPAWAGPAGSPEANLALIRQRAAQALTVNATFLALAAPTNAQVVAQVKALTRECNALLRMMLNALDDVSDT